MPEITRTPFEVACACGRKMTLDAVRGRGAYRCGCGSRVKVTPTTTEQAACVAPGCSLAAVTGFEINLCPQHRDRLLLELAPVVYAKYPPTEWVKLGREYAAEFGEIEQPAWVAERGQWMMPTAPRETHDPIVYFISMNGRVKIGTTVCLRNRLASLALPPDAGVILQLPGSYGLESRLHARFADERLGGSEWFILSPRILQFVKAAKRTSQPSDTHKLTRS